VTDTDGPMLRFLTSSLVLFHPTKLLKSRKLLQVTQVTLAYEWSRGLRRPIMLKLSEMADAGATSVAKVGSNNSLLSSDVFPRPPSSMSSCMLPDFSTNSPGRTEIPTLE